MMTQGLNICDSEQYTTAGVRTNLRADLKKQARRGGFVIELELYRQFGRNHTLKLERPNGAKYRRQVEAALAIGDHPVKLHHARENRPAGKMAVKVNQVARRFQREDSVRAIFFEQRLVRLCRHDRLLFQQRG